MVKIRLTRLGSTKRPFYRIVATDSRNARDSRILEILGTYDPKNLTLPKDSSQKEAKGLLNVKSDRIQYWLSQGAQASDTVSSLLKRLKIEKPKSTKAAA